MTTSLEDWTGRLLGEGRYAVRARLGIGGMGQVYLAHDGKLDRDVVVKTPLRRLLDHPQAIARFQREVRALTRLIHPHIVRVHDTGEYDGLPFVVMQYLPGGSLYERMLDADTGRVRPMPVGELPAWLPDVAAALDVSHRQGYIHRDVKPHNILFDSQGRAYLSDFGLARAISGTPAAASAPDLTATRQLVGTPLYLAPEVGKELPYDGRVDQYALAATVYQWVCGRAPFEGPLAIVLALHLTQKPPPPRQFVPELPEGLSPALLRGLAKEPGERFPDCSAFAGAVLEAVASRSALASPSAPEASAGEPVIVCPKCRKSSRWAEDVAGQRVRCPDCGQLFAVPPPLNRRVSGERSPAETLSVLPVPGQEMTPLERRPRGRERASSWRWAAIGVAAALLLGVTGLGVLAVVWAVRPRERSSQQIPVPFVAQPPAKPVPPPVPPVQPPPEGKGVPVQELVGQILLETSAPPLAQLPGDARPPPPAMPPFDRAVLAKYDAVAPADDRLKRATTQGRAVLWAVSPGEPPADLAAEVARVRTDTAIEGAVIRAYFPAPAPGGEAGFRNVLIEDQKTIARIMLLLEETLEQLKDVGTQDRDKATSRWQANHAFVRARLQAQVVFLYQYSYALAEMRVDFPPRDLALHAGWRLVPDSQVRGRGPEVRKLLSEAWNGLDALVKDYANTPWEVLARRQKEVPLGLRWEVVRK